MNFYDLSIIIPCYNLEKYIKNCIKTILSQEIDNYQCEIIFMCDSCTDNTINIIKETMADINSFKWTLKVCENRNPGQTRNMGVELAQGKYVWFIDGDDWLIDNLAIKKSLLIFEQKPELDLIKFGFDSQGFKSKEIDVVVWRYIFKYDFIKHIKFLKTFPQEDDDFIARIKERKPKQFEVEDKFYWYNYPRQNSVMYNFWENNKNRGKPPWKK